MNIIKKTPLVLAMMSCLWLSLDNVFAEEINETEEVAGDLGNIQKQIRDKTQRDLALSRRPLNVGRELLEFESDGLYALPQQALDNWANGRMFPDAAPK